VTRPVTGRLGRDLVQHRVCNQQGQRHLHPKANGVTPLLFVRETQKTNGKQTVAFMYLGPVEPAAYHGERPISIEWRLTYPMPSALVDAGRIAA